MYVKCDMYRNCMFSMHDGSYAHDFSVGIGNMVTTVRLMPR